LAEVVETTDVEVEIAAIDSTGQEAGSCPTNEDGSVRECECFEGFEKDENGDCVDTRTISAGTTASTPTTQACEIVDVDFDSLFDESMNNDPTIQDGGHEWGIIFQH